MAENRDLAPLSRLAPPAQARSDARPADVPMRTALPGPAKAAIIVRFLLNEGADLALETLPEELQARLADQMARMGLVSRETLASVAREFAEALDGVGLTFPNGLSGALSALDGKISASTALRLRREAGVRLYSDPWARLRALPVEDLVPIVEAEATEVAAVLLAKLDVDKAAALLGELPGPVARRIACAVSRTSDVTPEAVDRIGLSLAGQLDLKPVPAFGQSPEERLGEILNQSAPGTREEMLTALDQTDEPFAAAVRRRIFTFADIPRRIGPRDVPRIVKEAEADTLVTALAAAAATPGTAAAADFLLANLPGRMADTLRDEIGERGAIDTAAGETAMTAVTAAIRRLELSGDLALLPPGAAADD